MGALGYYEGFVPYVSNQYKNQAEEEGKPLSDKYIFEKILGKTYAAFKKDQINERVEKLGKLKPITINGSIIFVVGKSPMDIMELIFV
ncbi:TPA: ZmpA/ZmpB/ZmpC family metallo-endopeptidase [Streptococcus pneumoniae]